MIKKVCVGFDGSVYSYRAFEFAMKFARACGAGCPEIDILSVATPPEIANLKVDIDLDAVLDAMTQQYEELFKGLHQKAKQAGVTIRTVVTAGHAAEQIVKYVKDNRCDMVIMGQKGKSNIEGFLLGSVSRRVARHAPCTITIVK